MPRRPEDLLADAQRLIASGLTEKARVLLENLTRARPGFVDAHIVLGRLFWNEKQHDPALAAFRKAAEASRGHPQAWGIYVSALAGAGRKARARKAAISAPVSSKTRTELKRLANDGAEASEPTDPGAIDALKASKQLEMGEVADALSTIDVALALSPMSAALSALRGRIALLQGDPATAEHFLRRALSMDKTSTSVVTNLGLSLVQQARPSEAISLLEPGARAGSAGFDHRVNLASAYARAGRNEDALELTELLLAEAPEDNDVAAIHAEALIGVGRLDEAVEVLEHHVDRLPDLMLRALFAAKGKEAAQGFSAEHFELETETALRLADAEAEVGLIGAAAARMRRVAEAVPNDPRPFRALAVYSTWEENDPLVEVMRREADRQDVDPGHRGRFGKALGKALSDTGLIAEGFAATRRANAELRKLVTYDPAAMTAELTRLADIWDRKTIERLARYGDASVFPIFIVGLPRSGSTLIENALSRHSDVLALGEWPVTGGLAHPLRLDASAKAVKAVATKAGPLMSTRADNHPRITDKLLSNFLVAGLLAAAFPNARFVIADRDLRAICLSMFENPLNPSGHPYALDLAHLGRFAAGAAGLLDHWAEVLGDRLCRCRYEDLVSAPEPTIRALLDALELSFEAACLSPEASDRLVNTLSAAQVRRPVHTNSKDRWRALEGELGPLLEALSKYRKSTSANP